MRRREFLSAALGAAALSAFGTQIARAADGKTVLRYVPGADPSVLDPILTTSTPTRDHAYLIFDTLISVDDKNVPQPQMAESWSASEDFKTWAITLREGLTFHDGSPVRAKDVVASLNRWAARDNSGKKLWGVLDQIVAVDDRTVRLDLKERFTLVADFLGKASALMPAIMPERLALTNATTPVSELIGSGPYRFVKEEYVPGAQLVYERFEGYKPRADGQPLETSGPKVAHIDRIEWKIIPDGATAFSALMSGEIDWWQRPLPDLLPILKADPSITVTVKETTGMMGILRFNSLVPPFNNPKVRQLVLSAIDQADFMKAVVGDNSELWKAPLGCFPIGTSMASDVGLEKIAARKDFDKIKQELIAAGYKNEPLVMLAATDAIAENALSLVAADLFRKMGFNVDFQAMDWASVAQRRASKALPSEGGWSCFITGAGGDNFISPAVSVIIRGNGEQGWFGWFESQELEALCQSWLVAGSLEERQRIARDIQVVALTEVPFVPLGQYYLPTAYRSKYDVKRSGFPQFYDATVS